MRLKTAIFAATSALVLYACGPVSFYHKPGVEVARMQRDQTECQVRALKDAPVANQVQRGAPVYYPGRRICNAGSCYTQARFIRSIPTKTCATGLRRNVWPIAAMRRSACRAAKAAPPIRCRSGSRQLCPRSRPTAVSFVTRTAPTRS